MLSTDEEPAAWGLGDGDPIHRQEGDLTGSWGQVRGCTALDVSTSFWDIAGPPYLRFQNAAGDREGQGCSQIPSLDSPTKVRLVRVNFDMI